MDGKCDEHSGCIEAIETLKKSDGKQWEVIERIRNRPPVWMSLAFAAALGAIGWLSAFVKGT